MDLHGCDTGLVTTNPITDQHSDEMVLERGPRVLLRHPVPGDADDFISFALASRRQHQPWVYPPLTREAFARYLRRSERDDVFATLAIAAHDGGIAGVFNISNIVRGYFQSAFVGYYGNVAYARQGLMSEGLGLVVRHAFGPLRLHRLEANIQPGNRSSRALAERAGFRYEGFSPRYLNVGGHWRDHERWAITAEDVAAT